MTAADTPIHRHAPDPDPSSDPTREEFLRWAVTHGGRLSLQDWLDRAAAWRIEQALKETRGNRSAAARQLGIGRRTLYSKMQKLGL